MDYLRWILLAAGLVFIGAVYLIGRKRSNDRRQTSHPADEDLPEISTENWDDLDEAVGEVRIIARADDDVAFGDIAVEDDVLAASDDRETADIGEPDDARNGSEQPEPEPQPDTVIALTVLAREPSMFSGAAINSVAVANNMAFGRFNIYHRTGDDGEPLFSLVNMVEPGSFDPDGMHDMKTPGITLFMQLPGPARALDAFDEMLLTAHRIAETLEGRLCNGRRKPLTESDAEQYRQSAAAYDER